MDPRIRRTIELELTANGMSGAKKDVEAVHAALSKLIAANPALEKDFNQLIAKIAELARGHATSTNSILKGLEAQRTATQGLSLAYGSLDNSVKHAMQAIVGFASFAGFIAATKQSLGLLKEYNSSLLQVAASGARYGIGITQLETKLEKLGDRFALTRMETMQLFKQFEQSFGSFSMKGFENVMKNIEKAVGPSQQNIQHMLQQIGGVLEKIPDLQTQMERMNEGDKARLQLANARLLASGQISTAEYKAFQNYLKGSEQTSAADKRRIREVQEQQRVFGEFSKHVERIGLDLAKAMMPIVAEISGFLKDNKGKINDFFQSIGDGVKYIMKYVNELKIALAALVALWAGGKVIGIVNGLRGVGGMVTGLAGGIGSKILGGGTGGGVRGFLGNMIGGPGIIPRGATVGRGARLGAAGKAGGVALALGFASEGLGMVEDNQLEKGNYKRAGAAGLGSELASAGSYAATGALVGSVIPGLGTALGGAIGGLLGLAMNAKELGKSFNRLFGRNNEELKAAQERDRKLNEATQRGAESARKSLVDFDPHKETAQSVEEQRAKDAQDAAEDAAQKVRSEPLNIENFKANIAEHQESLGTLDAARKRAGDSFATRGVTFGGRTYTSLAEGREQDSSGKRIAYQYGINDLQKTLGHNEKDMSDINTEVAGGDLTEERKNELKGRYEDLKKQQDEGNKVLEQLEEMNEEVRKGDKYLADAEKHHAVIEAKINAQNELLNREEKLRQAIAAHANAQVSLYDQILQRAQVIGGVSEKEVDDELNKTIAIKRRQQDQIDAIQKVKKATGEGQTLSQMSLETQKQITDIAKERGISDISDNNLQAILLDLQKESKQTELDIAQAMAKVTDQYKGELGLLGQKSGLLQQQVQLMDNFAIGVGASVQMRQQAVASIEKEIGLLEKMGQKNEEEIGKYQKMMREGNPEQQKNAENEINVLQAKRLEIQSQILGKVQSQAELTRALRDGWISALGEMNTGAGRFTKIMISQQQNLATGLGKFKMEMSSYSGALQNAGGSQMEKVGFNQGTKFTGTQGEMTKQTGGVGGAGLQAYTTGRGDDPGNMQRMLRDRTGKAAAEQIHKNTAKVVDAGGLAAPAIMGQAQGAGYAQIENNGGNGKKLVTPNPPVNEDNGQKIGVPKIPKIKVTPIPPFNEDNSKKILTPNIAKIKDPDNPPVNGNNDQKIGVPKIPDIKVTNSPDVEWKRHMEQWSKKVEAPKIPEIKVPESPDVEWKRHMEKWSKKDESNDQNIGVPSTPVKATSNFNTVAPVDDSEKQFQISAARSSDAPVTAARANGSVTLSNLSVTVNYDDLDKLGIFVKKQIDTELDAREKGKPSLSNFGNTSGRNRVNA